MFAGTACRCVLLLIMLSDGLVAYGVFGQFSSLKGPERASREMASTAVPDVARWSLTRIPAGDSAPLDAGDPGLYVPGRAGYGCGEVLAAILGDQDVVLDAHPDAA